MTTQKVTLYIGTHNKTFIKYFGKTVLYHTKEDLQKYYHGSGPKWINHLKAHGDDVTMEVYGTFLETEVSEIALKFSKDNNIVESNEWANQIDETGLGGGSHGIIPSEESRKKQSDSVNKLVIFEGEEMTIAQRSGIKYSRNMKESGKMAEVNKKTIEAMRSTTVIYDGVEMTKLEARAKARGKSARLSGKKYNLFDSKDNLIGVFPAIEIREMYVPLEKSSKDSPCGNTNRKIIAMKKNNKEKYIGWYVILIK